MEEFTHLFARIAPSVRKEQLELTLAQPLAGTRMEIPLGGRLVEVWFHRAENPNAPVLFEMHGGGFILGDAAKNDMLRQQICTAGNIHVAGINYRKTPQHPYPAALEDVIGVIGWFSENADELGISRHGFFVSGESAGANLATAAVNRIKTEGLIPILGQILHYPFLDLMSAHIPRYPTDLPEEVVRAFIELYCDEKQRCDPAVSAVCSTRASLAGTPPTLIITAEYDTLKSCGQLYADLLRAAGTDVRVIEMSGAHHGYIEDWWNPACYSMVPEKEKQYHTPNFGELAERAVAETKAFIRQVHKFSK